MAKVIVIEGVDGSGKATQTNLLVEALDNHSIQASSRSFPNYDNSFFAAEIKKYLNGEYGDIKTVPVKFAASLYAGDRFESSVWFNLNLDHRNSNIILDRYTPSNIAHQCSKLNSLEEQIELQKWIEHLEYVVYKLPKPDYVFFLDVPATQSQKNVLNKDARTYTDLKQDLHEGDLEHLTGSHKVFMRLAQEQNWFVINCFENNSMRSAEDIHEEIFGIIHPILLKENV